MQNIMHINCLLSIMSSFMSHICYLSTMSAIRTFRRLCNQFSESSLWLPGQQGRCITTVELSENSLQNLGKSLMADSVVVFILRKQISHLAQLQSMAMCQSGDYWIRLRRFIMPVNGSLDVTPALYWCVIIPPYLVHAFLLISCYIQP